MNIIKRFKKANDLIYTVMATVLMNFILQIIIYPLITKFHGEDVTGNILYFIGIIYIVPQALGTSLSNVRLMSRKEYDVTNRDFIPFAVTLSALSALICGVIGFSENKAPLFSLFYGIFSIVYLLRIYCTVEFRLTLNFKGYFYYFCIICVGYLIGFGLYLVTDIWLLIFIIGEIAALVYSFIKGTLFKNDGVSKHRKKIAKTLTMVLFSTIVRDCVNQFDRVILKQVISDGVVTQYNAVSLIAKTILMLVQPINTLILTYLTVKDSELSKKQLARFTGLALVCGTFFYGICIVGTPIFVKLFYPNIYESVMQYNIWANLGLILGFISTMFMSILLAQGKTAIQMTIQCIWGIAYIIAAYYFVGIHGIWGLIYVTLVANAIKLIAAIAFTFYQKKKPNYTKNCNKNALSS